jgi:hypothetical protein
MADLSVADALALGNGRNYENDGMFGGNSFAWWIVILFLFMFANGGWGGFGGSNGNYNQITNDFLYTNLKSTIDTGLTQLANQGFSTQKDLLEGFAGTNNTMQMVGNGIQRDITGVRESLCQGFNGVNSNIVDARYAMQDCCCTTNRNIDSVKYENSRNTCDIITAQNANTQRILDKMCETENQNLRDQLAAVTNQLSQAAQNTTLINALRPTPTPAYLTCSPYMSSYYAYNGLTGFGC